MRLFFVATSTLAIACSGSTEPARSPAGPPPRLAVVPHGSDKTCEDNPCSEVREPGEILVSCEKAWGRAEPNETYNHFPEGAMFVCTFKR